MTLTPYLNLPGSAEKAINFYKDIFGGTTEIMYWSEMPPNLKMPMSDNWQNKIMHGSLIINKNVTIYLSDSLIEETPINNTVFLHVVFDTEDELRKAFDTLSVDGRVNMPVENTFWGSIYGDLVDKFGTGWGLEYPLPK
ncbi:MULTISPECIES: VOC family protein [unclassified Oceanispirochaeta]|uniref:VOC family protein n=1 Tax=unclassified Oceanispirochaeta TaxID=2635722 RepID=UPI000E09DAC2|nr:MULTISPECIES: VOC family protein [unclassified Oceanispirochaeta]MBF9015183.1 VOC family protein [Oceanispirochaeta sp. M2]NPD71641.1 VOC family protein [Oceanispirochaeta sp. M1]RDG33206.1 VOC family protein [Oceanispirochaeta sp. M1]